MGFCARQFLLLQKDKNLLKQDRISLTVLKLRLPFLPLLNNVGRM
jgi:hypothetical protein